MKKNKVKKILIVVLYLVSPTNTQAGYFENEEKILIKNCLKYFEKGKLISRYVNRYYESETVENSDEYYEIAYNGKYYNIFFGYKIYEKKFKYIVKSECVTIDFDKENKKLEK